MPQPRELTDQQREEFRSKVGIYRKHNGSKTMLMVHMTKSPALLLGGQEDDRVLVEYDGTSLMLKLATSRDNQAMTVRVYPNQNTYASYPFWMRLNSDMVHQLNDEPVAALTEVESEVYPTDGIVLILMPKVEDRRLPNRSHKLKPPPARRQWAPKPELRRPVGRPPNQKNLSTSISDLKRATDQFNTVMAELGRSGIKVDVTLEHGRIRASMKL